MSEFRCAHIYGFGYSMLNSYTYDNDSCPLGCFLSRNVSILGPIFMNNIYFIFTYTHIYTVHAWCWLPLTAVSRRGAGGSRRPRPRAPPLAAGAYSIHCLSLIIISLITIDCYHLTLDYTVSYISTFPLRTGFIRILRSGVSKSHPPPVARATTPTHKSACAAQ